MNADLLINEHTRTNIKKAYTEEFEDKRGAFTEQKDHSNNILKFDKRDDPPKFQQSK